MHRRMGVRPRAHMLLCMPDTSSGASDAQERKKVRWTCCCFDTSAGRRRACQQNTVSAPSAHELEGVVVYATTVPMVWQTSGWVLG